MLINKGLLVICFLLFPFIVSAILRNYQITQAVTDAGATVTIDFTADGVTDAAEEICMTNDGPNSVVYDFDGIAAYSATARSALRAGETLCLSRRGVSEKFTLIGFDCAPTETASVRFTAMP